MSEVGGVGAAPARPHGRAVPARAKLRARRQAVSGARRAAPWQMLQVCWHRPVGAPPPARRPRPPRAHLPPRADPSAARMSSPRRLRGAGMATEASSWAGAPQHGPPRRPSAARALLPQPARLRAADRKGQCRRANVPRGPIITDGMNQAQGRRHGLHPPRLAEGRRLRRPPRARPRHSRRAHLMVMGVRPAAFRLGRQAHQRATPSARSSRIRSCSIRAHPLAVP